MLSGKFNARIHMQKVPKAVTEPEEVYKVENVTSCNNCMK